MTPEELIEAGPVAWIIPGDDGGRESGWVDCMAWSEGEFTKPLYSQATVQSLISERDAALARVADTLCLDLQRKCVDMGVYWRAPDAHGVTLNIEQATDLLRDALGVEVEIRAAIRSAPNTRDAGPSPFSGRTTLRDEG